MTRRKRRASIPAGSGNDDSAEKWLIDHRWGGKMKCPSCGGASVSRRRNRLPMPYQCNACRKDFGVKTGTLMHRSGARASIWQAAFALAASDLDGVSAQALALRYGTSAKTIWSILHRIREVWDRESTRS